MNTKEIINAVKAVPNGKATWKSKFNELYTAKGFPFGDAFSECVRQATVYVCPHLSVQLQGKLNNNTANSVAEKLDR